MIFSGANKNGKEFLYELTENGDVFSISSNWRGKGKRKMKPSLDEDGYLYVSIQINGVTKKMRIHRLVANLFLPPKQNNTQQIRHLDGNKLNNNKNNLAWGTAKENANDRQNHGKTSKGEFHSKQIKKGIYDKRK